MIAIRRSLAALAVLATTCVGAPTHLVAPTFSALAVTHPDGQLRASRPEIRVTPVVEITVVERVFKPRRLIGTGRKLPARPKKKAKPRSRPFDPLHDSPHTQAGAEMFAKALPWPWPQIVRCESLRDRSWRVSARSWARGLFQFLPSTWRSLGLSGDPAAASWWRQYMAAVKLRIRDGLGSWDCARITGVI